MERRRLRFLFDSPEWTWLGLALVLRLGFAWRLGGGYWQIDELGYSNLARTLAGTGMLSTASAPSSGPPVPAALFALALRLFGPSLLAARLLQAFVGVLAAALIGRATATLTRSRESGRLALIVACIYPFFIYYGGLLMSETSYIALTVPALALLGLGQRDRSVAPLCAGGFLMGLAALARAEAAPIGLLVFAAVAAADRLDGRALRRLALAALCWSLPILLWCARNQARLGAFVLDAHGGVTLLYGTQYFERNEIDTAEAARAFEASELSATLRGVPPLERDRRLMRAAFVWMAEHPAQMAGQWAAKTINFWRLYPRADKTYLRDRDSDPSAGMRRGWLTAISLLFEPWLVLGGLTGLWALRARRELWPQWAFLLGTMGVHIFSVSQMRYRLPVMPALILGAAALAARGVSDPAGRR